MSFMLVVNRLDALINRVERLIAATTGVPYEAVPTPKISTKDLIKKTIIDKIASITGMSANEIAAILDRVTDITGISIEEITTVEQLTTFIETLNTITEELAITTDLSIEDISFIAEWLTENGISTVEGITTILNEVTNITGISIEEITTIEELTSFMEAAYTVIEEVSTTTEISVEEITTIIEEITEIVTETVTVIVEPAPISINIPAATIEQLQTPRFPNRYVLFRVDLTTAHDDEPIGLGDVLKGGGIEYATYMAIITAPSAFQFKINSTALDAIDAAVGVEWADFEITEIFITNTALAGTALIIVEFRVD